MTRRLLMTASLAGAVIVSSWAPSAAASPVPTSGASPSGVGALFTSTVYPYTVTLPPSWRTVSMSPQDTGDLFEGPGGSARVGSRGPITGQTVADRVAANRAELLGEGCTSDSSGDQPATLGGEVAIAWAFVCPKSFTRAINTIYGDAGYRLTVTVPTGSETMAPRLMEQFASTFAFTGGASPLPSPDLAAIDAALQGTWRTEWAPAELWIASVAAAGLDPQDGVGAGTWAADLGGIDTHRATLRFQDGQMVEYGASDGGADEFGSQSNYRLVDEDTIEATDQAGTFTISYDFTLRDGVLAMDVVSDTDPSDLVPQTSIYETLPFTRVP